MFRGLQEAWAPSVQAGLRPRSASFLRQLPTSLSAPKGRVASAGLGEGDTEGSRARVGGQLWGCSGDRLRTGPILAHGPSALV